MANTQASIFAPSVVVSMTATQLAGHVTYEELTRAALSYIDSELTKKSEFDDRAYWSSWHYMFSNRTMDFVSPLVVVRKSNGEIRICSDARGLNERMVKDREQFMAIDE